MSRSFRRNVLIVGLILLGALIFSGASELLSGHRAVHVFYRHCHPGSAPIAEHYRGGWGGFELTQILLDTNHNYRYDTVAYPGDDGLRCEPLPETAGVGIPMSFAAAGFSEGQYRAQEQRSTSSSRVVTASVARIYGDSNVIHALSIAVGMSEPEVRVLAGSIISGAWDHVRQ